VTPREAAALLADTGRMLFDRRLTAGAGGNISVRVDGGMMITPSGTCKGMLTADSMIFVDLATGEAAGGRPSMETPFHRGIYLKRPDVNAIVHCHPPACTALAVLKRPLRARLVPEGAMILGDVPMAAYASPGSASLADSVVSGLGSGTALMMESHGALTVGKDMMEAFVRMDTMEYLADLQLRCEAAGDPADLPREETDRLIKK